MSKLTKKWNKEAKKLLLGKKIIAVRYLGKAECEDMMWHSRPIAFMLDDETWVFPMRDDEGNDGGALAVGADGTLPVLGLGD